MPRYHKNATWQDVLRGRPVTTADVHAKRRGKQAQKATYPGFQCEDCKLQKRAPAGSPGRCPRCGGRLQLHHVASPPPAPQDPAK